MFDWILDPILYFLVNVLWTVLVTFPYMMLKYLHLGLNLIGTGLIRALLFGTDGQFSFQNLPIMFANFAVISLLLFFVFLIGIWIRAGFINSGESQKSLKIALQYSILSWVFIFVIPVAIFSLYMLIDVFINLISSPDEENIATLLFLAINPLQLDESIMNGIASNNFLLSFEAYKGFGGTGNAGNILLALVLLALGGIGVFMGYVFAGMSLLQKTFDQIFLFICSPFIAMTTIIDGGKRLINWRDQMIAKSLTIFSILIGSKIFVWVLGYTSKNLANITGTSDLWINTVVLILVALGGALAFVEFGNIIASFVGEGVGLKESAANTRSLLKSGMAAGGAFKSVALAGKVAAGTPKNAIFGKDILKKQMKQQVASGKRTKAQARQEYNQQKQEAYAAASEQDGNTKRNYYSNTRSGGLYGRSVDMANAFQNTKDNVKTKYRDTTENYSKQRRSEQKTLYENNKQKYNDKFQKYQDDLRQKDLKKSEKIKIQKQWDIDKKNLLREKNQIKDRTFDKKTDKGEK